MKGGEKRKDAGPLRLECRKGPRNVQKGGIIFDKKGKFFLFCRKIWHDFSGVAASFDLCFLSVYGNL